jgi:small subunit ribosomal protein S16
VTKQVAVRIRLTRVGSTKNPIYRIVVVDQRTRRDGSAIETVGHYNPRTDPSSIDVDGEKVKAWLAKGAQPSRTVKRLLAIKGIDK